MAWLLDAFQASFLNIAQTADQRTLILELFVYISLLFTLLTIPFLVLLKARTGAPRHDRPPRRAAGGVAVNPFREFVSSYSIFG